MYKLIILLFCLATIHNAQSFRASANKSTAGLSDFIEVSFTVEGKDIEELSNFTPPDFQNFSVIYGPNKAQSVSIVNGVKNSSLTLSYLIKPNKTGTFKLKPASIKINGKEFYSNVISLTINYSTSNNSSSNDSQVSVGDNVFIRASADKQKVLFGERIVITYKIYFRYDINSNIPVVKLPTYKGFWAEEVPSDARPQTSIETVNGKNYTSALLKKVILFPTETGSLEVTPLELDLSVNVPVKSKKPKSRIEEFFDDPFFSENVVQNIRVKSNSIIIISNPLPETSTNFINGIGTFKIYDSLHVKEYKANEPFKYLIIVEGQGNIKLCSPPQLDLGNGFIQYPATIKDEFYDINTSTGRRVFEYNLISKNPGSQILKFSDFSYFNPEKKQYIVFNPKERNLIFLENRISEDYTDLQDINKYQFIDQSELYTPRSYLLENIWFLTSIPASFLFFGLAYFFLIFRQSQLDLNYLKKKMASEKAITELEKGDQYKVFTNYLEEKFNLSKEDINQDRLNLILDGLVSNALKNEILALLYNLENIRFTGMDKKLNNSQIISLIRRIEESL